MFKMPSCCQVVVVQMQPNPPPKNPKQHNKKVKPQHRQLLVHYALYELLCAATDTSQPLMSLW